MDWVRVQARKTYAMDTEGEREMSFVCFSARYLKALMSSVVFKLYVQ